MLKLLNLLTNFLISYSTLARREKFRFFMVLFIRNNISLRRILILLWTMICKNKIVALLSLGCHNLYKSFTNLKQINR